MFVIHASVNDIIGYILIAAVIIFCVGSWATDKIKGFFKK
jgi:hypothetical protein